MRGDAHRHFDCGYRLAGGRILRPDLQPVAAADDTERIGFLRELGYEVTPQSVEVREVLIPDEFDEVFTGTTTYRRRRVWTWSPITASG